jgi:hypothetical protein
MQLIAPDILDAAQGLTLPASATALAVGVLLWLTGWRVHRFWIVLSITVGAGLAGLHAGRAVGLQVLVVGLLLAFTAGLLALQLARLIAFAAGGAAAWLGVSAIAPTFDQPLLCFLAGGLLGMLLFRLWTMTLTSFAGALLAGYAGLLGWAQLKPTFDPVQWSGEHVTNLNTGVAAATVAGVIAQSLLERWRNARPIRQARRAKKEKQRALAFLSESERAKFEQLEAQAEAEKRRGWLTAWLPALPGRRAKKAA